MGLKKILSDTY